MSPSDLSYAFPENAYLFYGLPLLALMFFIIYYRQKRAIEHYTSTGLEPVVIQKRNLPLFIFKALLFCFAWGLAVFASMGPQGNPHYPDNVIGGQSEKRRLRQDEVVLLIDASVSMTANDTSGAGTRFEQAKEISRQIIGQLKGEKVSVYAFTVEPSSLSPSSYDKLFAKMMIDAMEIDEGGKGGTDLPNTLKSLTDKAFKAEPQVHRSVIIMTDGGDKTPQDIEKVLSAAQKFNSSNFDFVVIGIGSLEGIVLEKSEQIPNPPKVSLNEELLKALAKGANGVYYRSSDTTSLNLANRITEILFRYPHFSEESKNIDPKASLIYDHYMFYPLAAAILALILAFFTPDVAKFMRAASMMMLFFQMPLLALDNQALNPAITMAAAGDVDGAKKQLTVLLSQAGSIWEEAIIRHDLGILLLKEKNYSEALRSFRFASPFIKQLPPNFQAYHFYNLALLEARLAENAIAEKHFFEAGALLELAKRYANDQKNAKCAFDQMIGKKNCENSYQSNQLDTFIAKLTEQLPAETQSLDQWDVLVNLAKDEQDSEKLLERLIFLCTIASEDISQKQLNDLLMLATTFVSVSLKKQEEGYSKNICQANPWKKVLPPFFEGEAILQHIAKHDMEKIRDLWADSKGEVIGAWEKALAAFKDNKSSKDPCWGQESSSKQNESSENSLEALQQMIKNDMPQKQISPSKQPGIKPW